MSRLLSGVRVLEFGLLFNGDMVGMLLGDMGADVIKVESPVGGDYLREMHGHLAPMVSPTHVQANKNKRSLTLDVRSEHGREVFWKLLATSDVFVDGLSAGACTRMGIGWDAQHEHRPNLIYCQHSGFGACGPYAQMPTHGVMPAAIAGGQPQAMGTDGFMHRAPSTDLLGGATAMGEVTIVGAMVAAMHVAAGLAWRQQSGTGLYIDVATSDAALLSAMVGAAVGLNRERLVDLNGMPPTDGKEWRGAKYQYYETADARVLLFCCMEEKFWARFCDAVGRADLLEPDASRFDYGQGDDGLRREVQAIVGARTLDEWMALAVSHGLPVGPAHRTLAEVRADPQLAAREIMIEGHHPQAGTVTYLGSAAMVGGQPYGVIRHAPAHGEHTDELLTELGYSPDEIATLRASRTV